MKLNTKRTIYVGFAFFLILAFWQAYDSIIPLILTNKFGMSQFWSGVIMALDNILALFLLPLFGTLSDKHKGKSGRRTPFIRVGTIAAIVLLVALSFADMMQLKNIEKVSVVDDPAALGVIYDTQADKQIVKPNKETATLKEEYFVLSEEISREDFVNIKSVIKDENGKNITNSDYVDYVVPARQAYIWQQTAGNPQALIVFVAILLLLLIAMAIFRSPAVALMPDVTPKPLRSKANAIINLMGYTGGILVLVLGKVFATDATKNALMSYFGYFCAVGALMLVALIIFLIKVKEPAWVGEMHDVSSDVQSEEKQENKAKRKLSKGEKLSLILLLASVILWYFGYNAVSSKYSVYASNRLGKDFNMTLMIGTGAAIISFVPVGILSSKIGRKKAILIGVALLAAAFTAAQFVTAQTPVALMIGVFVLAGFAWATINVNSFPMVVELCSDGDVGKYTGYYYTASMAAQTLTPMVSGFLMDKLGMGVLFPYAALFVAGSFVTMLFVKHGDSKVEAKKGLDAFDVED
ncbi:MAG: MFS transporter [Oscillospiraceae bacterium]|nr:MFS transporter [Oscillospiraceae bacterium]